MNFGLRPFPPHAPAFREIRPSAAPEGFLEHMDRALERLRTSPTEIGRATYAYLHAGRARVGTFNELTKHDFLHIAHDLSESGIHLRPTSYAGLHTPGSRTAQAIANHFDAYMWSDRIYVRSHERADRLASALVHETNHVINRSSAHYRGAKAGFREEYRAFYVEALFRGEEMTKERCRALKEKVIRLYGFDAQPSDVPDVPPGRLFPPGSRG
jgi:hypothetical protein